jgi:hypothetical protein
MQEMATSGRPLFLPSLPPSLLLMLTFRDLTPALSLQSCDCLGGQGRDPGREGGRGGEESVRLGGTEGVAQLDHGHGFGG